MWGVLTASHLAGPAWNLRVAVDDHGCMRPPRTFGLVRRAITVALALLTICGVAACSKGDAAVATTSAPNTVRVANFAFAPDALTVRVGDTVTWEFHQAGAPHNVVSTSGPTSFNSGVPQGKGRFAYTFTQPGTYTYVCTVHPNMRATVTVSA